MMIIPAIDLKDGRCVRLHQGDLQAVTVYDDDPAQRARSFAQAGFRRLHVVDLDGAAAGRPVNTDAVRAILAAAGSQMKVQIGGGIRSLQTAETWLGLGADRVILGTAAVKDPALLRAACAAFPGRVIVGIDAREGKVATEGWLDTGSLSALEVAERAREAGAVELIYTDIGRDGTLSGLNLPATAALAAAVGMPVIASGGLSGPEDLQALRALQAPHVIGAIAGKAIYDGRLSLLEAAGA